MQLQDQTILITGAAGRIGASIARELHSKGASLVLCDVNKLMLEELVKELNLNKPNSTIGLTSDISSSAGIAKLLTDATGILGRIHSAVHCAYPRSQQWGATIENLEELALFQDLSTQLGGAILLSKYLMQYFKEYGGGNLVHISSIQGVAAPKFDHYAGTSMHSPIEYSAIKAGVISITKWLARYYANSNIRVNCVSPGGVRDQQPDSFLKAYRASCTNVGMLEASQVAGSVVFLLSPESLAINGQNILVDDGWSL